MDKPTTWTPCRELEGATYGDATTPTWQRRLHDEIVGELRCIEDVVTAATILQLARRIVAHIVEHCGAADEILAEGMDRLEATQAALSTLHRKHAQLERELERARDELQTRTLQLANMEKLVTAKKEGN